MIHSTTCLTEDVTDWGLSEEDLRYPYFLRITPNRHLYWKVFETASTDWWGDPASIRRFAVPNYSRDKRTRKRPCKGEILMKKMGWKRGESLGRKGGGMSEPIQPIRKEDRHGIGYT